MTDKPKEEAKEAQQPKSEAVAPVLDEDDLFEEFHNEGKTGST